MGFGEILKGKVSGHECPGRGGVGRQEVVSEGQSRKHKGGSFSPATLCLTACSVYVVCYVV